MSELYVLSALGVSSGSSENLPSCVIGDAMEEYGVCLKKELLQ